MTKFNVDTYLKFAFGNKNSVLDDAKFERGLRSLAYYFVAKEILKGNNDAYGRGLEFISDKDNLKYIKDYLLKNYNLSQLENNGDFFGTKDFFANPKHKLLRNNLENETRSEKLAKFVILPDIINFYYKSGAFLRGPENKDAHQFDELINNIDNMGLPEQQVDYLKRKIDTLKEDYPTMNQLKEAYKDYIFNIDAEGLSKDTFTNLPIKDKREVINSYPASDIAANFRSQFFKAFDMKPLNARENALIDNNRDLDDLPVDDRAFNYERNIAVKKMRGNGLDKENVSKAIKIIKSLKELHDSRPGWQRLFFYFGDVGKENDLIDRMVNDLVSRGIDKTSLVSAINGDTATEKAIIDFQQTPERRKEIEKMERKAQIKRDLGINDIEQLRTVGEHDEKLARVYKDEIDVRRMIVVSEEDQKLLLEDMFKETEIAEFDLEDDEIIEEDFNALIQASADEVKEVNEDELVFDPNTDKGNIFDDELEVFDTNNRDGVLKNKVIRQPEIKRVEIKKEEIENVDDPNEWETISEDEKEDEKELNM